MLSASFWKVQERATCPILFNYIVCLLAGVVACKPVCACLLIYLILFYFEPLAQYSAKVSLSMKSKEFLQNEINIYYLVIRNRILKETKLIAQRPGRVKLFYSLSCCM